MATLEDVRRIAVRLPGVEVAPDGLAFSVPQRGKANGFAWAWAERVHPKKPKVRNPGVFAFSVRDLGTKEMLIGSDERKYFTEPHYNGFPAVLVRLGEVDEEELEDLIVEAWRCKAPAELASSVNEQTRER